jgi:hypothetical protein
MRQRSGASDMGEMDGLLFNGVSPKKPVKTPWPKD